MPYVLSIDLDIAQGSYMCTERVKPVGEVFIASGDRVDVS